MDFVYNVGIVGVGKSMVMCCLNVGNIKGVCEVFMWWNKVGGCVICGFVNCRVDVKVFCL